VTPGSVRARAFLEALYDGIDTALFIDVRAWPPVQEAFFPISDFAALEEFVKPRRGRSDVYFGVAARLSGHDGSLEGCGPLPALFCDLDFKDGDGAEARQRLASTPLRPSIIVSSGGGVHCYWLLKEPLDLQHEAPAAKAILRRLAHYLEADRHSAEPARILRLPNSWNHKHTPKRLVSIELFQLERRYNVTDFDEWLPAEPHESQDRAGTTPDIIPEGCRNAHLTSLAGSMRKRGMAEASIIAALLVENEARCRPPLSEAEVRLIARSVGRYMPDAAHQTAFVHSLPELLARAAQMPEPRSLVQDLLPGDGICLLHSQPREYKTLTVQALLLAVTTGTPAFGLQRLHVAEALPAWYITEEDSSWRVTTRFGQLLEGYGLARAPELLHISAGKGLNLDANDWQERIIATAREQGYRLVVIDPLRSVTETVDQGPRELKPFALFIRRFIRETGAVVLAVHHDVKPPSSGTDQRRRPQRASGGGVFSIADYPIHIDRVDDSHRMLVPSEFKYGADPPSVLLRLEHGPGWLRLVGEEATAFSVHDVALDQKILDFLEHSPYSYGNAIAKGVHGRREDVLRRLHGLETLGLVTGTKEAKGTKWFRVKPS
jgi:hypothetical protein